jgi:hypothetical protein
MNNYSVSIEPNFFDSFRWYFLVFFFFFIFVRRCPMEIQTPRVRYFGAADREACFFEIASLWAFHVQIYRCWLREGSTPFSLGNRTMGYIQWYFWPIIKQVFGDLWLRTISWSSRTRLCLSKPSLRSRGSSAIRWINIFHDVDEYQAQIKVD